MRIKIIFILSLLLVSPLPILAQQDYRYQQESSSGNQVTPQEALAAAQRDLTAAKRDLVMEETLRAMTVELSVEYGFAGGGEQKFELLDSQGGLASRLTYPLRGNIAILKGEVGFWSKLFVGGRYGNSFFKRRICKDEDWNIPDPFWPYGTDAFIDYQITYQSGHSKVEFYDANLYYRLLDFGGQRIEEKKDLTENLGIEKLSLDIFAGYQYQENKCRMLDPLTDWFFYDEGTWYYTLGLPDDTGLDSYYKIKYQGPRVGLRVIGSKDKFGTRMTLSYAYLTTDAEGWWNLRNLTYWQKGTGGQGVDFELEVTYAFHPNFSLGLGFNYIYRHQNKLKLYAVEDGTPWWEGYQNRVRDADSSMYFPTLIFKASW